MKLSLWRYGALALGQAVVVIFALSSWIYLYFGEDPTLISWLIIGLLVALPLLLPAQVLKAWGAAHPYIQTIATAMLAVGLFQLLALTGILFLRPLGAWLLVVASLTIGYWVTERGLARLAKKRLTKRKH